MKAIVAILAAVLVLFATNYLRSSNSTQDYINRCNRELFQGFAAASKCWTAAGENDEMLKAIAKAEAIPISTDTDNQTAQSYRLYLKESREWYEVRTTWKTIAFYSGVGAAAGVLDALGGSGVMLTSAAGAAVTDYDRRDEQFHQMQRALEALRTHCVKSGYDLGGL